MKLPISLDLSERLDRLPSQAALIVHNRRIIGHSGDSVEVLPTRGPFLLRMLGRVLSQTVELLVYLPYPIPTLL